VRILGIDPGLLSTGWGVVSFSHGRLQHISNGAIRPNQRHSDADRLTVIYRDLSAVIADYQPDFAAIEEIFVANLHGLLCVWGWHAGSVFLPAGPHILQLTRLPHAR